MLCIHSALGILTCTRTLGIHMAVSMIICSFALEEVLATTAQAVVTSAAWNWIGSPLSAIWRHIGCGGDCDIAMRAIVEMNCGVLACELQGVTLEAIFVEGGALWTETVAVPTTMLCAHAPTNLSGAASLPICWRGFWKHL